MSAFEEVYCYPINEEEAKRQKWVKVLKLTEEDNDLSILFVDIRETYDNKPTKKGVCLRPNEFEWVMEKFGTSGEGVLKSGLREVEIRRTKDQYNVGLITPNKESEIRILKEEFRTIRKKVKEMKKHYDTN